MDQNMNLITLTPSTSEDAVEVKCFSCGNTVKVSPEIAAKINGDMNGVCIECLSKTAENTVSDASKEAADTIKTALGD